MASTVRSTKIRGLLNMAGQRHYWTGCWTSNVVNFCSPVRMVLALLLIFWRRVWFSLDRCTKLWPTVLLFLRGGGGSHLSMEEQVHESARFVLMLVRCSNSFSRAHVSLRLFRSVPCRRRRRRRSTCAGKREVWRRAGGRPAGGGREARTRGEDYGVRQEQQGARGSQGERHSEMALVLRRSLRMT